MKRIKRKAKKQKKKNSEIARQKLKRRKHLKRINQ
jgi:hypothetical protein